MIEYEEVNVGGWTFIVGGQKEMTTGSITGLRPLTHYDIRVATVNSGIGPYTNSSNASTSGITEYTHTHSCCFHLMNLYFDCPGYSSGSESTTVIVGVVCSLVFMSVGVLLGAASVYLLLRARGKLSKSSSPSPSPVPQEVTYEVVDVPSSTQKTQLNDKDVYALSENIPTSHNTAYGQVQL